jgi:hypothetical protein
MRMGITDMGIAAAVITDVVVTENEMLWERGHVVIADVV